MRQSASGTIGSIGIHDSPAFFRQLRDEVGVFGARDALVQNREQAVEVASSGGIAS
jgi:hypothetical protein